MTKTEYEELMNQQRQVENRLALEQKTIQIRAKSGRGNAQEEVFGSYNTKTLTARQKEIVKTLKKYTYRTVKFVNSNTVKRAAKGVFLALRGDYNVNPDTINEESKY